MVNIIGVIATFLTTIAIFPQLYKSWKTKHTKDLSWYYFSVLGTGVFLWIIYGFQLKEPPIYISNIIIFLSITFLLYLKLKYDKK